MFSRGNIQNIIPSNAEWLLGVTRPCEMTSEWNFISNKEETNEEGRIKNSFFPIYTMICTYIYTHTWIFKLLLNVKKQRKRADNVMLLVTEWNVLVSSTS